MNPSTCSVPCAVVFVVRGSFPSLGGLEAALPTGALSSSSFDTGVWGPCPRVVLAIGLSSDRNDVARA